MPKKRVSISVNASSLGVAKDVVRRQMANDRISGQIVGGAGADARPDDKVAIYTREPNKLTWMVYVERHSK